MDFDILQQAHQLGQGSALLLAFLFKNAALAFYMICEVFPERPKLQYDSHWALHT